LALSLNCIDKLYECVNGVCGKYIFAGSTRIAMKSGNTLLYYHPDHQGSTRVVTNASGTRVDDIAYHPFGETRQEIGTNPVNHMYTGQELDSETGLYNYNARLYDPDLGRFMTPDSIVPDPLNPQSLNRYAYVQNNPINLIDPTGHDEGDAGGGDESPPSDNPGSDATLTLTSPPPQSSSNDSIFGYIADGWNVLADWGSSLFSSNSASVASGSNAADISNTAPVSAGDNAALAATGSMLDSKVGSGSFAQSTSSANWMGTGYGASSAQWYANKYNETGAWYYGAGGLMASLWTPETYIDTATTLSVGYSVAGWASRIGAQYEIAFWRYPNAGGAGLNVLKDSERLIGFDWHKFKLGREMVNRPHIDIPGKVRHWPW